MTRSIYLVFTEPVGGREDEFNNWYEIQHVPDVLKVDGVVGATRYVVSPVKGRSGATSPTRYLTVYELDDDPELVIGRLSAATASGAIEISSSVARQRSTSYIFTELGPHRVKQLRRRP
jgi:hypothetical protein